MSAHSLPDTCFGAYAIAKTSITINTASPSARHRNDRERQTAKGVHANVATVTSAASHGMYRQTIPMRSADGNVARSRSAPLCLLLH